MTSATAKIMENAKGTLDYDPENWTKLTHSMNTIRRYALTLDLVEIDTPILEKTELLRKKYGDEVEHETKLIYSLQDSNTSLRYDLTVPLSRYIASRGIESLRRFQIGKVFRKENPEIERGRYREFYQADVDILGTYEPMLSELELFWLIVKVLTELQITGFQIKYNYRQNLDHMCRLAGIAETKSKDICISLDKLDKLRWEDVRKELQELRGVTSEQCDILHRHIQTNYLDESLHEMDSLLHKNPTIAPYLKRDASLARGLDYYTGIIYEVIVPGGKIKTIIAGGRYDTLMKTAKGIPIPAIGVSFGVSRMLSLVRMTEAIATTPKIFVICPEFDRKLRILEHCRTHGFRTLCAKNPARKVLKQITEAVAAQCSHILLYGEDGDSIRIKELFNKDQDLIIPQEKFFTSFLFFLSGDGRMKS
jgi:histidyl-tRNA synthetase